MVGMSQIKKKMWQGAAIGLAVGVVGIGLTVWWAISTVKTYEKGTNKKFNSIYTKMVTTLNKDVIQGEMIGADMLATTRVHNSTVPTDAITTLDGDYAVGKVAKYNIAAKVPLTKSMVTDEIISSDVRDQEVNTVLMPSDLVEGDKVDVRIMYPNGTDYIVLAQKNVTKIAGQTMWVQLAEDERLLLNSAMVDSFLKQGSKLYATKYADADAQIKISDDSAVAAKGYVSEEIKKEQATIKEATEEELTKILFDLISKYKNYASTVTRTMENYQPNSQVMDMMKTNKNILEQAKEKLSTEARSNLENGINGYQTTSGEEYKNVVTGAQQSITNQKTQRQELLDSKNSAQTAPAPAPETTNKPAK
ncbi:MAG: SAF domain-containing protein [Clostridia bacterium]